MNIASIVIFVYLNQKVILMAIQIISINNREHFAWDKKLWLIGNLLAESAYLSLSYLRLIMRRYVTHWFVSHELRLLAARVAISHFKDQLVKTIIEMYHTN